MKSATDAEALRQTRDRAARRRLAARATPGLPVDGDAPGARSAPVVRAGALLDGIAAEWLIERSAFFDEVCDRWDALFPASPARPGRWQDGRLFLYVRTAGQLFALRPKLARAKKTLAALPSAPRKFTLHLEIRGV